MSGYLSLSSRLSVVALLGLSLACSRDVKAEIETVPVGADVVVTRADGGVVRGTLTGRSPETVKLDGGLGVRSVPRARIADIQVVTPAAPEVLPALAKFAEYTLPAGTEFVVTLNTAVHSKMSNVEDAVEAKFTTSIVQGETTVVPSGSLLTGEVTSVESAGKVKGRASLALRFRTLAIVGHHDPYDIAIGISHLAPATKVKDAATIGIPAAAGGIIGGILGGKKGAVTGVIIGGGAGTAVVLSTAGDEIDLPKGSTIHMTLDQPVEIRIPIRKGW